MEYNYQIIYTAQFESDLDSIAEHFSRALLILKAISHLNIVIKHFILEITLHSFI